MLNTSLTCNAEGQALGPVDVQVEPGRVGAGTVEQVLQSGVWFASCCLHDDLVAHALNLFQTERCRGPRRSA